VLVALLAIVPGPAGAQTRAGHPTTRQHRDHSSRRHRAGTRRRTTSGCRVRRHRSPCRRALSPRFHVRATPSAQRRGCRSPLAATGPTAVTAVAARAPRLRVANPFGTGLFGIAAGGALQIEPRAELHRDLANDRRAGARWIRVDVNWAQIQPDGPHGFIWRPINRVVRAAHRCGMHVLGTLMYSPPWTRPPGTSPTYSPGSVAFARFAREAARHLRPMGVHAFEIWNEPNSSAFFTPAPSAEAYAAMLIAADRAIKSVQPHATVVTGGMAPAANASGSIAPLTFLRGLYRHGAKGHFDAVGAHPYCWPAYPGSPRFWSAWYQMYRRHDSLRSIMIAHGDGAKRIWATEFGAPTDGPPHSGFVSDGVQAAMVARAYRLFAGYPWAGPLFLYQGRDAGVSSSTIANFFGFINFNFTRKPAYSAYQRTQLLVTDALLDSRRR
jgi:polysaccharide biosynthesis protein PslG